MFSIPDTPVSNSSLCANLWHLWNLRNVLGIFRVLVPCLMCSCLCKYSWTMTCFVCLSCHCLCEVGRDEGNLSENCFHRTLNNRLGDSMILFPFLCFLQEKPTHQRLSDQNGLDRDSSGIANSQAKLRLHTRHDPQTSVRKRSPAIAVEHHMILEFSRHPYLQSRREHRP